VILIQFLIYYLSDWPEVDSADFLLSVFIQDPFKHYTIEVDIHGSLMVKCQYSQEARKQLDDCNEDQRMMWIE
jgi:hypothetical protein